MALFIVLFLVLIPGSLSLPKNQIIEPLWSQYYDEYFFKRVAGDAKTLVVSGQYRQGYELTRMACLKIKNETWDSTICATPGETLSENVYRLNAFSSRLLRVIQRSGPHENNVTIELWDASPEDHPHLIAKHEVEDAMWFARGTTMKGRYMVFMQRSSRYSVILFDTQTMQVANEIRHHLPVHVSPTSPLVFVSRLHHRQLYRVLNLLTGATLWEGHITTCGFPRYRTALSGHYFIWPVTPQELQVMRYDAASNGYVDAMRIPHGEQYEPKELSISPDESTVAISLCLKDAPFMHPSHWVQISSYALTQPRTTAQPWFTHTPRKAKYHTIAHLGWVPDSPHFIATYQNVPCVPAGNTTLCPSFAVCHAREGVKAEGRTVGEIFQHEAFPVRGAEGEYVLAMAGTEEQGGEARVISAFKLHL